MILELIKLIESFLKLEEEKQFTRIYNEFSFQHELGIFLRENLGKEYNIEFERNISYFFKVLNKKEFIKKEIDIVVYSKDKKEKYAIELKHPLKSQGQHPEHMFAFLRDLKFLEELTRSGFTNGLSIVLTDDKRYIIGNKVDGIYKYFRKNEIIKENIEKPTGENKFFINIEKKYVVDWKNLSNGYSYYILKI
ncbi:hypothetical protein [Fusobacterium sp.]|uniref:hypothetical protein n=1 Tax=Fusobacterium sp. TaxID=68766 RepID=UPI0029034679|nr:hypothetical protein [Fusobacterium sp.]MDU1911931.1 hypothetical protein [Fusobacterium sp.]